MKTKIITTVGGFFAIFLANGIAYGAIFADKVAEVLQRLPEGMTQESLPMIMVGHFIQTLLLVGLLSRMNIKTAVEGLKVSALIHLGIFGMYNSFMLGAFTFLNPTEMYIDVVINMVTGGIGGAAIASLLGKFGEE